VKTKRSLEGYLLIDNRHAPPVSLEMARASGKEVLGAGVAGVVEMPVLTCSHCHRGVAVQPLRTRDRAYCRKCDHYICDECAVVATLNGGVCEPLTKRLDLLQEQAAKPTNLIGI